MFSIQLALGLYCCLSGHPADRLEGFVSGIEAFLSGTSLLLLYLAANLPADEADDDGTSPLANANLTANATANATSRTSLAALGRRLAGNVTELLAAPAPAAPALAAPDMIADDAELGGGMGEQMELWALYLAIAGVSAPLIQVIYDVLVLGLLEAAFDDDAKGKRCSHVMYTWWRSVIIIPLMYLVNKSDVSGGAAGEMGSNANFAGEGGMAVAEQGTELVEDVADAAVDAHEGRLDMKSATVKLQAGGRGFLARAYVRKLKRKREGAAQFLAEHSPAVADVPAVSSHAASSEDDGGSVPTYETVEVLTAFHAIRIQLTWRAMHARRAYVRKLAEAAQADATTRATATMQRMMRGRRSRKMFAVLARQAAMDRAARQLQRRWRDRHWLRTMSMSTLASPSSPRPQRQVLQPPPLGSDSDSDSDAN